MNALIRANIIPMRNDTKPSSMKSFMIIKGVIESITVFFYSVNLSTVLNRIIETASLVIPSPNTIAKRFGSFS